MLLELLTLLITKSAASSWGYDDTSAWSHEYAECGSDHQSPIDIVYNEHILNCQQPLLLEWTSSIEHFAIRNNGHSLQAIPFEIQHEGGGDVDELEILHHANDSNIRLKNPFYNTYKSLINSEYCFDSLHFHWSKTNDYGSEHAINGQKYPLELHLVHYSCDYYVSRTALDAYKNGQLAKQSDDNNVLSVIAVLFEIGDANPVLDIILNDDIIHSIYKYNHNTYSNLLQLYYAEFDLMDLLPSNKEVVAYFGSLTTPPCYETVRWNVLKHTMTVSQQQMEKLRLMLQSNNNMNDTIAPNWRPLQNINDRIMYECEDDIEPLIVSKEKVIDDSNRIDDKNSVDIWFVIGIIFICLCAISMIGNVYLIMITYYGKSNIIDENKSMSLIKTNNLEKKNKDETTKYQKKEDTQQKAD